MEQAITSDEDVPKLAPSSLLRHVGMSALKQPIAANDNQTSGKLSAMKFDHVFSTSHFQKDAPRRIIFTETVTGDGATYFFKESGVWIKFSPGAVPEPKIITCSLWRPNAVSGLLEDDETLVSSVIQLECDDLVGVNFTGITLALSHSAVESRENELVMKQLIDRKESTWKDLEAAPEPLDENFELQSELLFVQAGIKSFSLYAVVCRLKSYTFSCDASVKSPEFTCKVPEYPDMSVTIPRRFLSKDMKMTIKEREYK